MDAQSRLRSFLDIPPEHPFPIQNLPYGIFRTPGSPQPRVGVAIGDFVLDLAVLQEQGCFRGPELAGKRVFACAALNAFLALGPAAWKEAREEVTRLLRHDEPQLRDNKNLRDRALLPAADVELLLPAEIGDYTDFYASRHHALNVSRIFRGAAATLPPQYLHLPIGYHGRSSSIVVSGAPVRRPHGQFRSSDTELPDFGPTRELDFELEMGALIGLGNPLGEPIPVERAAEHIFGLVLLNDWSARDIQQWEYQPLGPFLGKNFATTISPWVVPMAALEPFRCPGPEQGPPVLPYLKIDGPQAYDIHLCVELETAHAGPGRFPTSAVRIGEPAGIGGPAQPGESERGVTLCRSNLRELYWSLPQMVAHHTVNGCNLRPGDLLGTGTISGPTPNSLGCLLELTRRGAAPLTLPTGAQRVFLEDGDTVTFRGWCEGPGYRIGFGECRGEIVR